jgi:outer membrane protein assembly factor BamB
MKKMTKTQVSTTMMIAVLIASILLTFGQPAQADVTTQVTGSLPDGANPSVQIDTSAHLSVRPNLVGKGQELLVNLWTSPATHAARHHEDAYIVTITKPDMTTETHTLDSYPADGTAWFDYYPDQTGVYQFQFEFLGTFFPAANLTGGFMTSGPTPVASAYYKPSSSPVVNVTVQEDIVASWSSALPTDYWTRPAHVENREWWTILGNFPPTGYVGGGSTWDALYPETSTQYNARGKFIPWVEAPDTAHIVWKRQGSIAGLIGGQTGQYGYSNSPPTPSILYAGRAYDSYAKPGTDQTYWRCYDLRTGEVYWEKPVQTVTSLMYGFFLTTSALTPNIIEYASPTQSEVAGAEAAGAWTVNLIYFDANRLYKWDPWTGVMNCNVSLAPSTDNVSSGTYYQNSFARDTDPLVYSVQTLRHGGVTEYRLINWTTRGTSANFTDRIRSNTTYVRSSLPTLIDYTTNLGASVSSITVASAYVGETLTGYDLITGQTLWVKNISEPMYSSMCDLVYQGKLATLSANGYYVCFDLKTGEQLWTSDTMDYPWSSSGFGAYSAMSAYGMIIREAQDGIYAFDWDTGKQVWKYEAPANPFETPYTGENGTTVYPFYSFGVGGWIADGKFYTYTYEHTESWPVTRGWGLHCINATTGEGIWKITGSMPPAAIADGYLVAGNPFDGYTYCFGKGQSETTIEAPMSQVSTGDQVIIKGTVLDMSPAQEGTPCISAQSMNQWMDYLHMQQPIPSEVIGVPVSIDAVDPNGNYVHIADVTSDMSGTYGYTWQPTISGQYTIMATFAGDGSYGSSWAQTYVSVVNAPGQSTQPSTSTIAMPPVEMYAVASTVAIIIAIAVVGLLLLRKRP